MTTALEGGEGSVSRPGRSLPSGKIRHPLYRRLGGPQGWSGQVRKIWPQPGFDPRSVQPVVSRYCGYATRNSCYLSVWEMKGSADAGNICPCCWNEELCLCFFFFVTQSVEREWTRQATSLLLNIGAHGLNHCRSGKAIRITYSECVYSLRYPTCGAHATYCRVVQ